jgi:FKBP-type peptidyl-prolyl cis-trans isomerase
MKKLFYLMIPALFLFACNTTETRKEIDKMARELNENTVEQDKVNLKIEEGANYLAENGKREGVVTTASGLQYEVISLGKGAKPTAANTVKVHYRGTLLNGTVFDSSIDRGEPISFPLNGVIAGWTEGLQLMPVGSKFRFVIPYNLAYGERGASELIGPYETLIFEVELLAIEK